MLTVLAFMAVAIRAVVPAGYMLGADDGRFVSVMLCGSTGWVEALVDRDTGAIIDPDERPAPKQTHDNAPCVFAMAAPLVAPESAATIATSHVATIDAQQHALRDARPGLGLAAPPPWSTGPPSIA
jgi:hypothetical protein